MNFRLLIDKCDTFDTVEVTKDFISDVWEDGRISLKCKNNGKYLKGFGTTNENIVL